MTDTELNRAAEMVRATPILDPQVWTRARIISLPSDELRAIVRSTKADGIFADQVAWAKGELGRRQR